MCKYDEGIIYNISVVFVINCLLFQRPFYYLQMINTQFSFSIKSEKVMCSRMLRWAKNVARVELQKHTDYEIPARKFGNDIMTCGTGCGYRDGP